MQLRTVRTSWLHQHERPSCRCSFPSLTFSSRVWPLHPAVPTHAELRRLDTDGDGKLTIEEVEALLKARTPPTWDQQLAEGVAEGKGHQLQALESLAHTHLAASKSIRASHLVFSAAGMFASILLLGIVSQHAKQLPLAGEWHAKGLNVLLGSFGTLAVLLFARPDAEPVRVWNLVVGHLTSVAAVVVVIHFMGPGLLSRALAMALGLAAMMVTDSVHPPGGALILMAQDSAVIQSLGPWFLLYPSLAWTCAILLPVGAATNWLKRHVQFDWPQGFGNAVPAPVPAYASKMA